MVDGDPDEYGWKTMGYAWMANAYMLSRRALRLIMTSNYHRNLMYNDEILPAIVSATPLRNIREYAEKSGISNRLRACQCISAKCHFTCEHGGCGIKMHML